MCQRDSGPLVLHAGLSHIDLVSDAVGCLGQQRRSTLPVGRGRPGTKVSREAQVWSSCISPCVDSDGREVTTIGGLAEDDALDVAQHGFVEEGTVECGYSTIGFVLAIKVLLAENSGPTVEQAEHYWDGVTCRCPGHEQISGAVFATAGSQGYAA